MANENLFAKMRTATKDRESRFRDEYENYFQSERRRPALVESREYALRVLQNHYQGLSDRRKNDPCRPRIDGAEVELAGGAVEAADRAFRDQRHIKRECEEARTEAIRLRAIVAGLTASVTLVMMTWSEDAERWCDENCKDRWKQVRDDGTAYFMFEDKQTAAKFKLLWT